MTVTAPVLVVAPEPEPAPPEPAHASAAPVASPPPAPETVSLIVVNANHGAKFPGDRITVDAEYGAALVRNGEAVRA